MLPICNTDLEDWLHLYLCPSHRDGIMDCLDLIQDFISVKVTDYVIDLEDFFDRIHVWNIPKDRTTIATPRVNFIDFLRGFIPYNLPIFLRTHLDQRLSSQDIHNLCLDIQSYVSFWFLNGFGATKMSNFFTETSQIATMSS